MCDNDGVIFCLLHKYREDMLGRNSTKGMTESIHRLPEEALRGGGEWGREVRRESRSTLLMTMVRLSTCRVEGSQGAEPADARLQGDPIHLGTRGGWTPGGPPVRPQTPAP